MYIYSASELGQCYCVHVCCRFYIPMADDVDEQEVKKDPQMLKAIKVFKATYVSPIQLRYVDMQ